MSKKSILFLSVSRACISLSLPMVLGASMLCASMLPARQAHADYILQASVGKSMGIKPNLEFGGSEPTLMGTFGLGLGTIIRGELGVVVHPADPKATQLRPMVELNIPLLPIYGRGIFVIDNMMNKAKPVYSVGAGAGFGISLFGLGVFAELNLIQNTAAGSLIADARVGASFNID